MWLFLDYFFLFLHTGLTLFNLLGWIWRRTRRWHLVSIVATWASWLGLGMLYGFGYCPCTDWHWQVKRAQGETDLPSSYIKYYLDRISGADWDAATVDIGVVVTATVVLGLSLWFAYRDRTVNR